MFINIWNHPKHIICVFRHFSLDFMLFLTSKLLKNVNVGALGHFGQHIVLTMCVCVICPNKFWGLASIYLKSLFPKSHVMKSKTHLVEGGIQMIFFVSTGRWWNNHLHFIIFCHFLFVIFRVQTHLLTERHFSNGSSFLHFLNPS